MAADAASKRVQTQTAERVGVRVLPRNQLRRRVLLNVVVGQRERGVRPAQIVQRTL